MILLIIVMVDEDSIHLKMWLVVYCVYIHVVDDVSHRHCTCVCVCELFASIKKHLSQLFCEADFRAHKVPHTGDWYV